MKTCNMTALVCLFLLLSVRMSGQSNEQPMRIGVAGVSHGHLHEVIVRLNRGDFQVVGVAEEDDGLRARNGLRGKVADEVFFKDLEEMLDKTRPEAVVAYGSIYDHLAVVEACAPRGIHVMVEKPLAVNVKHARRMTDLARRHNTLLLTNYETSWYAANHEAKRLVEEGAIGDIFRINVYDGHRGPVEIGCGKEFTDWLTDPKQNGGGAVIDFGCYGANLSTWLLGGQRPRSVYAVLKQQKPGVYPLVDDDATILVEYPSATVQINASWCWPMNRKDMHIYGHKGWLYQDNATDMRISVGEGERRVTAPRLEAPCDDSFRYLKAAVRGDIQVAPTDLASPENNLIVVEILDAAIRSARTYRVVRL